MLIAPCWLAEHVRVFVILPLGSGPRGGLFHTRVRYTNEGMETAITIEKYTPSIDLGAKRSVWSRVCRIHRGRVHGRVSNVMLPRSFTT